MIGTDPHVSGYQRNRWEFLMPQDHIVSIGFLTQSDLRLLSSAFQRHFPVAHDDLFAALIDPLDNIEVSPLEKSVMLRPTTKRG